MSKKIILPEAVAQSYSLAPGTPPRFAHWQHGDIDVTTISIEKADALYEAGCEYLVKVKDKKPAKGTSTDNETV